MKSGFRSPRLDVWIPLIWIVLVFAAAIFADRLPLPPPDRMDWDHPASPPGSVEKREAAPGEAASPPWAFLLGSDTLGRDMFSRLVFGARVSLAVGLAAPAVGMVFGGLLGMLAGFQRGRTESAVMGIMDGILAFPGLVLLLTAAYVFGQDLKVLLLCMGLLSTPAFCRVARANTLTVSGLEFVQAAQMMGASRIRVMLLEILPNIFASMLVYALFVSAYMIVAEGALSFLGLGVPPPTPSWGGMIAEGKEVLEEAPHVAMIPAVAMFFTVLSFNLLGDSLRSRLDPERRQL